jgi:hypothetical protein
MPLPSGGHAIIGLSICFPAIFQCNSGCRREEVWSAQRQGAKIAATATSTGRKGHMLIFERRRLTSPAIYLPALASFWGIKAETTHRELRSSAWYLGVSIGCKL